MNLQADQEEQKGKARFIKTPVLEEEFSQLAPNPISFINTLASEAVALKASDIIFEPAKNQIRVRFTIDGVLYDLGKMSADIFNQVSSRIKVLSKLDPTEKRKIQEGRFTIEAGGKTVNLRVEIAQTILGELIVIRIHQEQTVVLDLKEIGFSQEALEKYQEMIKQRSGLILVCGPTGCGKTTTLYSTINKVNENYEYNVMTIEDPVEFQLEGVNQMQVQEETGFTFAAGLRTILRLSPDIILVGEIRDRETAEIAVESGLTGQLVFSTVHAEDSVGTLLRLLDLGIETYLLNSALLGIIAQRLVRKVCQVCKTAYEPSPNEVDLFNKVMGRPPTQLFKGQGCTECLNLAYKGRAGIFEVLGMDSRIRGLVRSKTSEEKLRNTLVRGGFESLLRSGLMKCEQGITTVDEVLRNSIRFL